MNFDAFIRAVIFATGRAMNTCGRCARQCGRGETWSSAHGVVSSTTLVVCFASRPHAVVYARVVASSSICICSFVGIEAAAGLALVR